MLSTILEESQGSIKSLLEISTKEILLIPGMQQTIRNSGLYCLDAICKNAYTPNSFGELPIDMIADSYEQHALKYFKSNCHQQKASDPIPQLYNFWREVFRLGGIMGKHETYLFAIDPSMTDKFLDMLEIEAQTETGKYNLYLEKISHLRLSPARELSNLLKSAVKESIREALPRHFLE